MGGTKWADSTLFNVVKAARLRGFEIHHEIVFVFNSFSQHIASTLRALFVAILCKNLNVPGGAYLICAICQIWGCLPGNIVGARPQPSRGAHFPVKIYREKETRNGASYPVY